MALVTLVFVGLSGELTVVLILVAVGTKFELYGRELGVLALGEMATVALHHGVPVDQGVVRLGMSFHVEQRWLPSVDCVAGRALDSVGPALGELPVVIVHVAIGALGEGQLLFKVALGVARLTLDRGVLAEQGILGLGMVKVVAQSGARNLFPAAGVMAGLTRLVPKTSLVGTRRVRRRICQRGVPCIGARRRLPGYGTF